MRTAIINRFSPERSDYPEWLKDLNGEFIMVTKPEHAERFTDFFKLRKGFSNIDTNDSLYVYLVELHRAEPLDYIIAAQEFDLLKAGQLRDYLGLPGQNAVSARAFRDKVFMKELVQGVVDVPAFRRVDTVFDILSFVEDNGYPVVIKPVDGAGSVQVQVIRDSAQLYRFLEKGVPERMEIESFVPGDMYHVDGLYQKGELLISRPSRYINGCMAFHENKYLGSVMLEPANPLFALLNSSVKKVLDTLPTPEHTICFHAEFFYTPDQRIVLCEIACRAGGGEIVEALVHTTGINILRESVRAQCGGAVTTIPTKDGLAGWLLIPPNEGVLESINSNPPFEWVVQCTVKPEHVGKAFTKAESSVDQVASLLIEGNSEQELEERMAFIYEWMMAHMIWKPGEQSELQVV